MSKKAEEVQQNVVFRMTPSEIERLDQFAERMDMTRSQLIRNLVTVGMEEVEVFEKMGLARAAITVRDICAWMSNKVTTGIQQDLK